MVPTNQPPLRAAKMLAKLMAEHDQISQRKLAAKIAETAKPGEKALSHSTIGNIRNGADKPSVEALEAIARGLGEPPEVFLEVRLAYARRLIDEDAVGVPQALDNLAKLVSRDGENPLAALEEAPRVGQQEPPARLRGRGGRSR